MGGVGDPGGVGLRGLHIEPRRHDAVPDAADLGALHVELADERGLEPAGDHPAGDRILLEPEHRDAEAVQDVLGAELIRIGLADLNVQRIDGDDVIRGVELAVGAGVGERPGPLLGHHTNHLVRRRGAELHLRPDGDRTDDHRHVAQEDDPVRDLDPLDFECVLGVIVEVHGLVPRAGAKNAT